MTFFVKKSPTEIIDYAARIGIDPKNEEHLLYLAREGLMQALPSDWKPW
jgi:centrosomal protein CEP164